VSWNGSGGAARPPIAPKKSSPSALRGLIAGAVVVAIAAVAYFVLTGDNSEPKAKVEKKASAIKEVTPAPAPKGKNSKKIDAAAPRTVGEGSLSVKAANTTNQPVNKPKDEVDVDLRKFQKRTFEFDSEEQIAMLLKTKPGDFILGDCECGDGFVKDFNESLFKKIEIKDDDDEDTRQLKLDVTAAKAELKAAMDRGEDITKIIKDAYYDLQRIGRYKDEVEQMVAEMRKDDKVSYEDYEDLVTAANKMLEEKGAAPIRHPKFFWRNLKYMKGARKNEM